MNVNDLIKKFEMSLRKNNGEDAIYVNSAQMPNAKERELIKKLRPQIIEELKDRKQKIDNYFKNLDNAKIYCLSYTYYYLDENNEGYKETRAIDPKYFDSVKYDWLRDNKKYFVEIGQSEPEPYEDPTIYYIFKKENVKPVKIKNLEKYQEQMEAAQQMSDEDFEDIYGVPRSWFL